MRYLFVADYLEFPWLDSVVCDMLLDVSHGFRISKVHKRAIQLLYYFVRFGGPLPVKAGEVLSHVFELHSTQNAEDPDFGAVAAAVV